MEDTGPSRENLTWTDAQMDYLVQLLVEQARIPGMKSGGGLKSKAYTAIEKGMMDRFGPDFSKDKIKNKLKYSKPNLTIMKEIMNTSGFGYDPINKCIEVDPQVWSDYIEKYPNRKKYRGPKLWRYFEEFAEVFGDSHATGQQSNTLNSLIHEDDEPMTFTPASQSTPIYMNTDSSHSFTQMLYEDSHLPQSPVPPTPTTENPMMGTSRTTTKCKRQRSNNYEEYYNLLHGIADDVHAMANTCRGIQFRTCCDILQEMLDSGHIDSDTQVRSMDMLADGTNYMIFINLPPSQRVSWLRRRLPDL